MYACIASYTWVTTIATHALVARVARNTSSNAAVAGNASITLHAWVATITTVALVTRVAEDITCGNTPFT